VSIFGGGAEGSDGDTIVTVVSSSKFGWKSISSEPSVSSMSGVASMGAADNFDLDFLLCLPFRGMIEFAQDLTLRGFRLPLRVDDLDFSVSFAELSSSVTGEDKEASREREREGSDRLVGSL
jgi:hypothetical protein